MSRVRLTSRRDIGASPQSAQAVEAPQDSHSAASCPRRAIVRRNRTAGERSTASNATLPPGDCRPARVPQCEATSSAMRSTTRPGHGPVADYDRRSVTPVAMVSRHQRGPGGGSRRRDRGDVMTGTTLDDYTDRYARRVRGMTASEIRALFAVASRPEVVSLAGGAPYIAALPLDAVGEMLGRLGAEHGATTLQYGIGQGTLELRERICEVMALSGIDVALRRLPGGRGGHRRRAAGARPGRPALPRPGRRGARRGADLRRRARRVPGRPGAGGARADGRRRADPGGAGGGDRRRRPAPAGGRSSSTPSRPTRTRPA